MWAFNDEDIGFAVFFLYIAIPFFMIYGLGLFTGWLIWG